MSQAGGHVRSSSPVPMLSRAGFSLMELLVVLIIMALIVGVVSPAALGVYDKSMAKVDVLRFHMFRQRAAYEAFIRQKSCTVEVERAKEDEQEKTQTVRLLCGDKPVVATLELPATSQGELSMLLAGLPQAFNEAGLQEQLSGR